MCVKNIALLGCCRQNNDKRTHSAAAQITTFFCLLQLLILQIATSPTFSSAFSAFHRREGEFEVIYLDVQGPFALPFPLARHIFF